MSIPPKTDAAVLSIGAGAALVGTFLTWVRSGTAGRSSYELFGLVERLGFADDGAVGLALRLWPLVPLLLVLAVVVRWWSVKHPVWTAGRVILTLIAAGYPGVTAIAVANAPDIALFDVGPGPTVTAAGAGLMLVSMLLPGVATATHRVRSGDPSTPAGDRS